jgi:hypothetical protein
MSTQRRRLFILCEDSLHRSFIEGLAARWGIGPRQRMVRAAPVAKRSAAQFVLDNFVDMVRLWRAGSHDRNVGLLVVIDGDEHGLAARQRQLAQRLADADLPPLDPDDPRLAIVVPTWHMETWIAWLCGHRPLDERTRYKSIDPDGREVGRKIESGEYSVRRALGAWTPPAADEAQHVPSLAHARTHLTLGVPP